MRIRPTVLVNTPEIELWPAHLLRARSNANARVIARATHVLRRKRDGRFLAASTAAGLETLAWNWRREAGVDAALRALAAPAHGTHVDDHDLPLARIEHRLHALGLDAEAYGARTGLALVAEPAALAFAGFDRYRRPLWLRPAAARAWHVMQDAARRDGIALEAISGYRSHDYQLAIFERKLARGQTVDDILTVNAAPGYSEHHAGRALDISSPGEPPAEESFERTAAFEWLQANAGAYGFVMSYPRDNPHGIVYEPWHWCHRG
ncbi:D-alanyl-D-alanine carboxypeptidase family protein [Lysobacter sp. TY2-98]|uniref:M15 family metallopeptidase n=1 Tax=Lysobacter sp. TY2-98 TaxID=2290922 RepID=UPI000E203DCC|nr:M15 family metallopeptidase [Lysobacter sp. TY2-98]AXK72380.1 D-alanyl-D-alanine carboxypeptidase family protein [Lysobacter sp. TY2-98]